MADVVFLGETRAAGVPLSFAVRTHYHISGWFFKGDNDKQTQQWIVQLLHSRDYHSKRMKIKQQMERSLSWRAQHAAGEIPSARCMAACCLLSITGSNISNINNSSTNSNSKGHVVLLFGGFCRRKGRLDELHLLTLEGDNDQQQQQQPAAPQRATSMRRGSGPARVWRRVLPQAGALWPSARYGHSVVRYRDTVIMFGGNTATGRSNEVWVLQVAQRKWMRVQCQVLCAHLSTCDLECR